MLKVIAALFVVLGLIGLTALILKFLQNKVGLKNVTPFLGQQFHVDHPINIDPKHQLVSVTLRGSRYTFLFGPHNDILLDTQPVQTVQSYETQQERKHA